YSGLTVRALPWSSVIQVLFEHSDPAIVQPVLRQVIDEYMRMHVAVHRSAGMVGDFLTQETDQLRSRLAQTEEELRRANSKAGVISVEDAKQQFTQQSARLRQELLEAQAELATRQTILEKLAVQPIQPIPDATEEAIPSADTLTQYRRISERVSILAQREQELLTQFTSQNSRVEDVRTQLAEAESLKRKLEEA